MTLSAMEIENARLANTIEPCFQTEVPAVILTAIARADKTLKYSAARHIFHCIWFGGMEGHWSYCGVFGDGGNAAYEWFIWQEDKLEVSNKGYGDTNIALRDVLNVLTERGRL
jgi:hypothetical protein